MPKANLLPFWIIDYAAITCLSIKWIVFRLLVEFLISLEALVQDFNNLAYHLIKLQTFIGIYVTIIEKINNLRKKWIA